MTDDTTVRYVIWSYEHTAWWGPDHCGYTLHLEQAGRYTYAEADDIVRQANLVPGTLHECALLVMPMIGGVR